MAQLTIERRHRERMTLRCPVAIFVPGDSGVQRATTLNISSRGLYCLSDSAFPPGVRLRCWIEITPQGYQLGNDVVCLDCLLEVVRVERTGDVYGIGCRIVRYLLTREPAQQGEARVAKQLHI
jgi:hypothetical protein